MRLREVRPTGGINGSVVDAATGGAVAGALVRIRAPGGALSPPTVSGDGGEFLLAPLPEGEHDFVVEQAGYGTATAEHVRVDGGFYSTVTVKLRPDPSGTRRRPTLVPPVFLSGPAPHYPSLVGLVEGRVLVTCVISVEGKVKACVSDANPDAIAPVIRELESRRYRPALRDGRPFEVCYIFRLDLEVR
jgi:Carboxypeptidase regulatory-like domain